MYFFVFSKQDLVDYLEIFMSIMLGHMIVLQQKCMSSVGSRPAILLAQRQALCHHLAAMITTIAIPSLPLLTIVIPIIEVQ